MRAGHVFASKQPLPNCHNLTAAGWATTNAPSSLRPMEPQQPLHKPFLAAFLLDYVGVTGYNHIAKRFTSIGTTTGALTFKLWNRTYPNTHLCLYGNRAMRQAMFAG